MSARYKLTAKYGVLAVWNADTLQQNFILLCFSEWSETGRRCWLGMFALSLLALPTAAVQTRADKVSACSSCGAGMHPEGIQCRLTAVWTWRVGVVYMPGNIESEQRHSSSTGECSEAHQALPVQLLATAWATRWKDGRRETTTAMWCGNASPPAHLDIKSILARVAPRSQPGWKSAQRNPQGRWTARQPRSIDLPCQGWNSQVKAGVWWHLHGEARLGAQAQLCSHLELITLNGPAQHQWLDQLRLVLAHGDGPGIKAREMFSQVSIATELFFFWTPCIGIPQLQHSGEEGIHNSQVFLKSLAWLFLFWLIFLQWRNHNSLQP